MTAAMPARYIGLMSGTSLDGVDAVLVDFDAVRPSVLAHVHAEFDAPLRAELLALNTSGTDEIHRAALAANALARVYATQVRAVLDAAGASAGSVRAVGAHGQTVRHRPGEFDGVGYTIQINAPALLAEATGIDVCADFRSRDVAAGGQGAPLVPAFHRDVFGRDGEPVAVLNLGGMSNLTVIDGPRTIGFDCGPGNALMDGWIARHRGERYDRDGAWAAAGRVDAALLTALQADSYFAVPPPKSTGRDHFHLGWVEATLSRASASLAPADVQATLAALTSEAAAAAVRLHAPSARRLIVCGGGARNTHLMRLLRAALPIPVEASDEHGLPADQVEACAFAWLAKALIERKPGNLPGVTGARGPRVLGALYPGGEA